MPQLDWFFKYLLVFFSNSFENKVEYNRNISKLITFIFRNGTIFWNISK